MGPVKFRHPCDLLIKDKLVSDTWSICKLYHHVYLDILWPNLKGYVRKVCTTIKYNNNNNNNNNNNIDNNNKNNNNNNNNNNNDNNDIDNNKDTGKPL